MFCQTVQVYLSINLFVFLQRSRQLKMGNTICFLVAQLCREKEREREALITLSKSKRVTEYTRDIL